MEVNNWNDKIENRLRENIESCTIFERAHNEERKKYKNMFNRTILAGIVIMIFNTLLSSLASYSKTSSIWLNITIAILSAFSAAIGTVMGIIDPAKKLSTHTDIRDKYKHIIQKIDWILFLDKNNREEDGYEFLAKICQEMMELEIGEDTIPIVNRNELNKNRNIMKRSGTMRKVDNDENNSDGSKKNNIIPDIENEELINGLSEDENIDFSLLFKNTSSANPNPSLLNYQMQRFNRV
jgi:hypothetical protein